MVSMTVGVRPQAAQDGRLSASPNSITHLLSMRDVDRGTLDSILGKAERGLMDMGNGAFARPLRNKRLAKLFYEPSTRTTTTFEVAMVELGGTVVGFSDAKTTSAMKGESLEDAVRFYSGLSDVIVLRHPEVGAGVRAAAVSKVPVINAGDGPGEHPTQAALDLFTMKREVGRVDGLRIAMVGDLKNGRTVHSLLYALSMYEGNHVVLIAPEQFRMPPAAVEEVVGMGLRVSHASELDAAIGADVIYQTRIQQERPGVESGQLTHLGRGAYIESLKIDRAFLDRAGTEVKVMHPGPRNGEISTEIDGDPRLVCFEQWTTYAVAARKAILEIVLRDGVGRNGTALREPGASKGDGGGAPMARRAATDD